MLAVKVRDQAYIKRSNLHAVLELLREMQPISRKELTRLTEMSPTSITRIVGALLTRGLILEGRDDDFTGRGRKSIQLTINPDGLYTLGFLVNYPRFEMCVMNFNGQILYRAQREVPREKYTVEQIADKAYQLYQSMPKGILPAPERLMGVGVGMSGIVDHTTGTVEYSAQMYWRTVDVRAAFERSFGLPVWVENDVKAGLIGEKARLGIPTKTDAAYLYLAPAGIATAVTSAGELVRGERNAAGEVAHIALTPSDLQCDCGRYGCLQLHLVEHYLVKRAQKIEPAIESMESVVAAYRQHLAWAQVLISDFKRHLLLVIALLDSFCNPAKIFLCGDIFAKMDSLLHDILDDEHVIVATDYAGASIHGAAMIAMRHTLSRRLREVEEA